MHDFLLSIDNKEVLNEILHHSIDYLIGNQNESHSFKLSHKYGQTPDYFISAIRAIGNVYRHCCLENTTDTDLLTEFGNLSPELRKIVPTVLAARRPEILKYLIRCHNSRDYPLVESFDWDVRFLMGDSSYAANERKLTTVTLNCREPSGLTSMLHLQMDRERLDVFIEELEKALEDVPPLEEDDERKNDEHDKEDNEN